MNNDHLNNNKLVIEDDMVVSLDYVLRLDDGEEVDSSEPGEPLEILQGYGQIIPGLEDALYGMAVGEDKHVVVDPVDGYGDRDANELQVVPRNTFPHSLELTEGMALEMHDEETGDVFDAYIYEIHRDTVVLDFNHSLAGETLHFDVRVIGLRPATDTELEHGHVHDDGHEH